MPLAVIAVVIGLIMALAHNTKGDLVVGTAMAIAGGCFIVLRRAS